MGTAALLVAIVAAASALVGVYVGILSDLPNLDVPIDSGRSAPIRIYDSGEPPTLLAELAGPVTADPVSAEDMSETLRQALIATKDDAFPGRGTMSVASLAQALGAEIWGGATQSASPLTLGFIRENYVAGRTHPRPYLYETVLAYRLEQSWSKERILTSYLNTLYFGEGCYGVAAAAQRYFSVRPAALTTAQAAMLIGLALSPGTPTPRTDPTGALEARDHVLNRMFQEGYLDGHALQLALAEPVELKPAPETPLTRSAAWTDYIEEQLVMRYGASRVLRGGFTVSTTLNLSLQDLAEATLNEVLSGAGDDPQGVLLAVDLANGALVAMAQTPAGDMSSALSTAHEAGPLLRPLILAAAFERGISPLTPYPAGADQMILWQGAAGGDAGTFAHVAQQVGPQAVRDTAAGLGMALSPNASDGETDFASVRLTPVQAATLFTALAAGGKAPVTAFAAGAAGDVAVQAIVQVESPDGSLADHATVAWRDTLSTDTAYLITSILAASALGPLPSAVDFQPGSVATLAASSPDGSDAWFVGYSSSLLTVVWIGGSGKADPASPSGSGASTPAATASQVWAAFMARAAAPSPQVFAPPATGEWQLVTVCQASGETPSPACPATVQLLVPLGLVPTETCQLHSGSPRSTTSTLGTTTTDTGRGDMVGVPNVVGLSPDEAEARLAAVGLGLTCTIGAPGSHPGLIASQNPSPGTSVRRGQSVSVIVEALPPTPTTTEPHVTSTTASP